MSKTAVFALLFLLILVLLSINHSRSKYQEESAWVRAEFLRQANFNYLLILPAIEELEFRGPFWLLLVLFSSLPIRKIRHALAAFFLLFSTAITTSIFYAYGFFPETSHLFPLTMFFHGLLFCLMLFESYRHLVQKRNFIYRLLPLLLCVSVHQLGNILVFIVLYYSAP